MAVRFTAEVTGLPVLIFKDIADALDGQSGESLAE
jgi:hypothetical protein